MGMAGAVGSSPMAAARAPLFFLCGFAVSLSLVAVKHAKERGNIAREVVKTERAYCKILGDIVNVFLNPLKEGNLLKDGVITEENRRKIFPGALATLAQVHKDFLDALEGRVNAWTASGAMGDLFLNMIPYFKLYPVYVSDFENQMKALKEAKNNERFWAFIKNGFQILKVRRGKNECAFTALTCTIRIPPTTSRRCSSRPCSASRAT